jgi:hypothetical protein
MVDWHRYPGTEFKERRRFCARWRREFPARRYGDDFLMLDADGPGQFIGFVYGIRLLDDTDRWSHGGADNIYLDGEGQQPAFLRGIGGEDVFGASYGGALHPPETHLYAAMPYYVHEDVGQARPAHRLVGYRFFDPDPIPFQESIHARFGSMSNDICATTYWYSEKPVRPFFRLPPWDRLAFLPRHFSERDASRELPQGTSDLPLPASGEWWLCGPFGNAGDRSMNQELPAETLLQPDQVMDGMHEDRSPWLNSASREAGRDKARWLKRPAVHGFIDFNHLFRPIDRGAAPTHPGVAVARCILLSPHETTCQLQLAWDDRLILRVNDRPPVDLGHHAAFRKRTVDVPLRAGPNTLVIKLSNTRGTNHGGWAFALLARTSDGTRLLPRADDYAHPRPEVPPH